ncbi:MAG TPA: DUF1501 domain-containing protein [Acidimicrobiales bacterium]|nr:DUF1501 domain-containing protein [Acidimicrobiales bacterium]
MPLSRRQFLAGSGGLAGLQLARPLLGQAGAAFGADPRLADRRRLIVIFQSGGNDGLNTVVPRGDVAGAPRYSVYRKVRPGLGYAPTATLPLDRPADAGHALGLNPKLTTMHRMYREGRVAVVQGVDYPKHSYSHFTSGDVWQSGEPGQAPDSGWIGRHLDRAGISEAELRAVAIGSGIPLIMRGRSRQGSAITSIASTAFVDGDGAAARARHLAFARYGDHPGNEPVRQAFGRLARSTTSLVGTLHGVKQPANAGSPLANQLLLARTMLQLDLGVEVVFVQTGGYDTHTGQIARHEKLLDDLDAAIEVLFDGTYRGVRKAEPMSPSLAARTLVMTISEFGRRIGQNGAGQADAGTDHGAAAPVLLIGPATAPRGAVHLVGGIHGDHPKMGTVALPADNLAMTTDVRRLYQSVLQQWLGDPDPLYGKGLGPLPGLFA